MLFAAAQHLVEQPHFDGTLHLIFQPAEEGGNPVASTLGAEDFAFMLRQRPSSYFFIGNGNEEHRESGHGLGPCILHNPSYDFNDNLIPFDATLWDHLVRAYMPEQPPSRTAS